MTPIELTGAPEPLAPVFSDLAQLPDSTGTLRATATPVESMSAAGAKSNQCAGEDATPQLIGMTMFAIIATFASKWASCQLGRRFATRGRESGSPDGSGRECFGRFQRTATQAGSKNRAPTRAPVRVTIDNSANRRVGRKSENKS